MVTEFGKKVQVAVPSKLGLLKVDLTESGERNILNVSVFFTLNPDHNMLMSALFYFNDNNVFS